MNKGIVLTLSMLLSVNLAYSSDCGSGNGLLARVKGACTRPLIVSFATGSAVGYSVGYAAGKTSVLQPVVAAAAQNAALDYSKLSDATVAAMFVRKVNMAPVSASAVTAQPVRRSASFDNLTAAASSRNIGMIGLMDGQDAKIHPILASPTQTKFRSVALFTINGPITPQQVKAADIVLNNPAAASETVSTYTAADTKSN